MIHRFGDRQQFAIEPGEILQGTPTTGIRNVDLWAAGRQLSCDDSSVFVPQFCLSVEATITWLLSDHDRTFPHADMTPVENHKKLQTGEYKDRKGYFFMDWGPTTDNVSSYLFRHGMDAVITFEFWRETHLPPDEIGRVFVAVLPERKLIQSLHQAVCVLRSGM